MSKTMLTGISMENQDQRSPTSVLEPPFEDDNADHKSLEPVKCDLIHKSPHLESIASPYPLEKPLMVSLDTKVEEQEWLLFVEKLLSEAGFDDQIPCDSFYTKWHSLESPFDPSLRDKYANYNLNDKELQPLNEANRIRQMRSNQKLAFDCVNVALMEITDNKYLMGKMCSGSASPLLVDHVVAQSKGGGTRGVCEDCRDRDSMVVAEGVVREEVMGKGWVELTELEMEIIGWEIEGKLIDELVEKLVLDFIGMS